MSNPKENLICVYLRVVISAIFCLGIAGVITWALVPVYDPEAILHKFKVNEADSKIKIEMQLTNPNYFRGFNYTDGYIEVFYLYNNSHIRPIDWEYTVAGYTKPADTEDMYQGFKAEMSLKFSLNISTNDKEILEFPLLKSQETHLYVSLFLTYHYKILFWKTKTDYYQWLEFKPDLNDSLEHNNKTKFDRITDFNVAFSD